MRFEAPEDVPGEGVLRRVPAGEVRAALPTGRPLAPDEPVAQCFCGPTPAPTPTPATPTDPPSDMTPVSTLDDLEELIVHFIDVGQGDATLLEGPDFSVLIDAGRHDREDVVPYLETTDIDSFDLLIGTHPHADHIGQFPQVLEAYPVTEGWMSADEHDTLAFEQVLDAIEASDAGYHEPRVGENQSLGSAELEVMNPDELSGDLHEGAVSLRVVYDDVAFMFTGDADEQTEKAMGRREHDLMANVLQIGHRGSCAASTGSFLDAVQPEVGIYSAGDGNQYGHPHAEALERLTERDIRVYGMGQCRW